MYIYKYIFNSEFFLGGKLMKKGKILFIALIFIVSLVCISAINAADDAASDIVADTNDASILDESTIDADLTDSQNDELDENGEKVLDSADDEATLGIPAPPSFSMLDEDINGNDDTLITLERSYVYLDDGYDEGVSITRSLTIDGNGHYIDGYDRGRIFYISNGADVTLKNLILERGFSSEGGAIYVYGGSSLTLINCTFANNTADLKEEPQGGINIPYGGAVYVHYNSNCNVIDSKFYHNIANASGGAIAGFYDCNINIFNSTFSENGVMENIELDGCGGDAILVYRGCNLVISKSIFDNNNFENNPIAAIQSFESSLTVSDSSFANEIGRLGSAINGGSAVNCTFSNNAAYDGGAVYNANVEKCIFTDNHADHCGGAIYNCVATNCNFTGNSANEAGGAAYGCSAMNCNFIGNSANNGGAIANGNATNSLLTDNSANNNGGAIYEGKAINCNFTSNNALYSSGGAIYNSDATNCYFENNKAQYSGGGAMYGGTAVNCTFTNNYASDGGAIYLGSAFNSTFTNNGAEFRGGAMVGSIFTNERCYATNCIFSGNVAPTFGMEGDDNGGAIYLGAADSCVFNGDSCKDVIIYLPTLTVSKFTSTYNSGDKLVVDLKTNSGMPIIGGKIIISVYTAAGAFIGNYNALSNVGWKVPFKAGSYKATYIAEDFDIDSVQGLILVNKAKSTITSKAVTAIYNNNKYLVITLKDAYGKAMSGAKVTVTLASAKTYTTNKNGQIKINIGKLVPKTYTAKIVFAGNANYLASSTTAKVVVKKATPKMSAKAKSFRVGVNIKKYAIVLKNNLGKVMKNTKVTLTVNKKTFTAKTNSKGIATFKITNLKKKGKFTAVIKYAGSNHYNKLSRSNNNCYKVDVSHLLPFLFLNLIF